jgi:hypothetical protein
MAGAITRAGRGTRGTCRVAVFPSRTLNPHGCGCADTNAWPIGFPPASDVRRASPGALRFMRAGPVCTGQNRAGQSASLLILPLIASS